MAEDFDGLERDDLVEPVVDQPTVYTSGGIAWGLLFVLIGLAAIVVFAVQNTDPVPVRFLWMEGEFPLALVILITAGVSVILTEIAAFSYRKRRARRRTDKAELKRYRKQS